MIDENGFGYRLETLMIKAEYSNSRLTKELNVSKNAVGNYKNNQIPNAAILYKISQLLGTSMEYLLTGKENNDLTLEEKKLVEAYRRADEKGKEAILATSKIFSPEPEQETLSTSRTG